MKIKKLIISDEILCSSCGVNCNFLKVFNKLKKSEV